ncbi:hypothetical protein [Nocardia wallacei]|uniref:hypothetical protein n=1 Tax=Nocardia wallacei TaxID=480035 RepID=UPI00245533AC|nr:hypothetical protein [Nocardia wallacei]
MQPHTSLAPNALVGQRVLYRLTLNDCAEIGARRNAMGIINAGPLMPGALMPAVFVPVSGGAELGLHVMLNGPDSHWVPFPAGEGPGQGQWTWPA